MKKLILISAIFMLHSALAFDWTYSTNLFWSITSPTNIFCGTNSTDSARDSYIVIWNKINADVNLLWNNQTNGQAVLQSQVTTNSSNTSSNTAAIALLTGGITTNIQFTDTALLSPTTNTLYFTNGILRAVTSP